jgi:hypothetical protein
MLGGLLDRTNPGRFVSRTLVSASHFDCIGAAHFARLSRRVCSTALARHTLARGVARTGRPAYTCAAATAAAARERRRRDKAPAWVWPSSWRRHRLGVGAGSLERCGGWLFRRTTGACCWRQRCIGGASSLLGCMLDSTEPREVCRLHYCLGEPRRLCRRGMSVHGATRTGRPVWVWLSSWRRRRLGAGAGA